MIMKIWNNNKIMKNNWIMKNNNNNEKIIIKYMKIMKMK